MWYYVSLFLISQRACVIELFIDHELVPQRRRKWAAALCEAQVCVARAAKISAVCGWRGCGERVAVLQECSTLSQCVAQDAESKVVAIVAGTNVCTTTAQTVALSVTPRITENPGHSCGVGLWAAVAATDAPQATYRPLSHAFQYVTHLADLYTIHT